MTILEPYLSNAIGFNMTANYGLTANFKVDNQTSYWDSLKSREYIYATDTDAIGIFASDGSMAFTILDKNNTSG